MENIIENLKIIEQDSTVPRNVRSKIKSAITALEDPNDSSKSVKKDRALQELDDLSDDPNLSSYTRTQIWNVVSTLESIE